MIGKIGDRSLDVENGILPFSLSKKKVSFVSKLVAAVERNFSSMMVKFTKR
jgi:hypothetical protein